MSTPPNPLIIQGGMGAAVSSWTLAQAVAQQGQMGVVSGTALDLVLARRLQQGDPDGHLRRALGWFPIPEMANRVLERYLIPGGKDDSQPFRAIPVPSVKPSQAHLELLVVANFVEVALAKAGHEGPIGINYLEKVQLPTLPSLFGAMLAGVDYVLMGAGIPRAIPGFLDRLAEGKSAELTLDVQGADRSEKFTTQFDPAEFLSGETPTLTRPKFLAIISSATLATMLARKATGHVDGFVVEGATAGGHNAPPRGAMQLNEQGEPIYGDRDQPALEAIAALGRPFWLAGSYGSPQRLIDALDAGAAGIQVGTAFAFCEESGMRTDIKRQVVAMARRQEAQVFTDPVASPTGFPFKVLQMPGTISEACQYEARGRVCDLGYLRHAYKKEDGKLGWRCPSEEIDAYLNKGGELADTVGRKCVCNGLLSNVDLGQVRRNGQLEKPLITCGDEVRGLTDFLPSADATSYTAADVVAYLLSEKNATCPTP